VLVLDIEMPNEDGYALMRSLRRSGDRTPAVALTAYGRGEDRKRALAAGFDMHLSKPIDPGELTSRSRASPAAAPPRSWASPRFLVAGDAVHAAS
jgi:CheY-like chemotaxis protein